MRPDFVDDKRRTTDAPALGEEDGFVCGRHLLRRGPRRRTGLRRAAVTVAAFLASLLIVTLLVGAYGFMRLRQGPIVLDLKPQILAALNGRVGAGYRFDVGATSVGLTDAGPALNLDRLSVSDSAARPIVAAPEAAVAVDPLALLVGRITPTRLDIHAIDIRLLILPDGQVAVSAGADDRSAIPLARAFGAPKAPVVPDPGAAPTASAPLSTSVVAPLPPANAALQALAAAMRTLVDTATASDSPLNALQRVSVTGRIVLDDRTRGVTTTFQNAALAFDRDPSGAAILTVAADGPAGRWSLSARANVQDDGVRTLAVDASGLSLDEITLAGGLHSVGFDFDMPVSAKVNVTLSPDGSVDQVGGTFDLGAGYFKLDDPDHEPLLVDSFRGGFHLDHDARAIVVDRTVMQASGTSFTTTGRIDFPKLADDPWTVRLDSSGVFGAERPGEKPIPISTITAAARFFPVAHRLTIDRIRVAGPDVDFEDTADIRSDAGGVKIHNAATVRHMPAPLLVRLWPSFVAAKVRAWLLVNLTGGTVENGTAVADLDGDDLKLMHVNSPVADGHVHVAFDVSGLGLDVMSGVPPLTGIDASGTVTGHTFDLQVRHGELDVSPGRRLTLVDGTFKIPDNLPKIMPAAVQAHVQGAVDVLADLLARDALKSYASLPLDPGTLRGQFDGQLSLGLKVGDDVPPGQVTVTAEVTATNLAIDRIVGKQGLTDATIKLDLDKGNLHARGDGRILGAPAAIELRKPASGAGEAQVVLALDEAARARAGFNSAALKGVVGAKITAPIASGEKTRAVVELDFAKASIDGLIPGFSKPMGKPGRASLTVVPRDGGTSLDDVTFDGGGAAARGSIELDREGGFASAKLSQVRLSPGDDMRIDAQDANDVLKVSVRAANLDARPFLKSLSAPGGSGSGEDKTALDLDLHSGILTGQNSQAITGADLRLSRRGGRTTRVTLSGRLARQPITITTQQVDNAPHLLIRASDAGATLLFMDLYRRMAGGTLDANVALISATRMDGYVAVHDFTLREDPALRKLAAQGLASQNRETSSATETTASTVDPSAMTFRKLEASFTKIGNDIEVRDGSMFGPTLGATVSGRIDFARDQVNLGGTFVPLFGVNNLFSQLPVLGPLLGGNKHEGLVGLSYQITGSAANPVLNVNPFSVLAPGILRQVFGALDPTQPGFLGVPRDRSPTLGTKPVEQE